jgi:hypothetical protein
MTKVGKSDGEATSPRRAATEGLRRLQTFPLRPGTGRFDPQRPTRITCIVTKARSASSSVTGFQLKISATR